MIASLTALFINQLNPAQIASNIQKLNSSVSDNRANFLGQVVYRESQNFDLDPNILTAILKQESNFAPNKKVCYLVSRKNASFVTCDYGISQINEVWLKKWKLDPEVLVKSDSFNIHVMARVLSIIRRQFGAEENWFSRYNTSGKRRAIYEEFVKTYLAEIDHVRNRS